VADTIRKAILDGQLPLGSPLVEVQIARQMGISRAPLREALRTLEQEGLVVTVQHRGTAVAALSDTDLEDIYYYRAALECFAVRSAVQRGNVARLAAEVADRISRVEAAIAAGDRGAAQREDLGLHDAIVRSSGQSRLIHAWEQTFGQIRLAITALSQHPGYPGLHLMADRHRPILAALQRGDGPQAEAAVYEHVVGLTALTIQRARHVPAAAGRARSRRRS
jgi:DNA-binding GntR family transcriptional regulator